MKKSYPPGQSSPAEPDPTSSDSLETSWAKWTAAFEAPDDEWMSLLARAEEPGEEQGTNDLDAFGEWFAAFSRQTESPPSTDETTSSQD